VAKTGRRGNFGRKPDSTLAKNHPNAVSNPQIGKKGGSRPLNAPGEKGKKKGKKKLTCIVLKRVRCAKVGGLGYNEEKCWGKGRGGPALKTMDHNGTKTVGKTEEVKVRAEKRAKEKLSGGSMGIQRVGAPNYHKDRVRRRTKTRIDDFVETHISEKEEEEHMRTPGREGGQSRRVPNSRTT